jgi:glycosyltransferase involved in cell wall biosynthesis
MGDADGQRDVLTSLYYPNRPAWRARVDMLDRSAMGRARFVLALVSRGRRYRCLVLNGAERLDQLAAALVATRRRRPALIITDCTWKRPTGWIERAASRVAVRLLERADVTYCVLSTHEHRRFAQVWGVAPSRVVFTPFCFTLPEDQVRDEGPGDGSVFAGGDSLREYGPLTEAAASLGAPLLLATSNVPPGQTPANVRAGPLTHEQFVEALRRASVVVVPILPGVDRSAGQQTYLNAMALGKIVVVTDSPGARDYVEDGVDGRIVPPGDADALTEALRWALEDASGDVLEGMRACARRTALERFGPELYVRHVLGVVDLVLTRDGRSR